MSTSDVEDLIQEYDHMFKNEVEDESDVEDLIEEYGHMFENEVEDETEELYEEDNENVDDNDEVDM